jgi:hypothetical protein
MCLDICNKINKHIILPFYKCETLLRTLREEHRLRVLHSTVLRKEGRKEGRQAGSNRTLDKTA